MNTESVSSLVYHKQYKIPLKMKKMPHELMLTIPVLGTGGVILKYRIVGKIHKLSLCVKNVTLNMSIHLNIYLSGKNVVINYGKKMELCSFA